MVAACRLVVAHQRVVAVARVIQVEVHVESGAGDRELRMPPLRDECGLGEFLFHREKVSPDSAGSRPLVVVALDQGLRHVDAEAVAAVREPEAHHFLDRLARRARAGVVDALLPCLRRLLPAVIERGLALEEVQHVDAVALEFAADVRAAGNPLDPVVRPDVAVGVLVALRLAALQEPLVLLRRVPRHQVQKHVDPAGVRLAEQAEQVLVRAVARRGHHVIPHVVPGVLERRVKAGVDPERVAAESLDVIQFFNDSLKITDAVRIRVVEGLRVDLIEYCIFQPCRHVCFLRFFDAV